MFYRPHPRVLANTGERSRTKQAHKDECDINNIVAQYQRTGIIQHVHRARGTFEDLPDPISFQEGMNQVIQAQEAFAQLPSKVRDYFGNDPSRFLAAFEDPKQEDQLRAFGLIGPIPEPAPVIPPAPAPT